MNNLSVKIYSPFSTSEREDMLNELENITVKSYSTTFPGGLYVAASLFVPRPITLHTQWKIGDRLVIRNGLKIVWEGELSEIGYSVEEGAIQGLNLKAIGYWGSLLSRTIDRRWCDTRVSADVWKEDTTASGAETSTLDRKDRLRITPKSEAVTNGDDFDVVYALPTNETVGRVAGTRRLEESSNAYRLQVLDSGGDFLNITATGTAAFDVDHPGTPSGDLIFRLEALANQTAVSDGTEFGALSGLKVYRYPSTDTDVPEVYVNNLCKDMQTYVTDVNSDTKFLQAADDFKLEPFYTDGREPWNSVLTRAAAYGDNSGNALYVRLLDSEKATSPDGKPVIQCETYPVLTDYDYGIRVDEENLTQKLEIVRSVANVANWIIVEYDDIDRERTITLTAGTQATLTDATSVSDWGQRDLVVKIGEASAATALKIGELTLADRKDPKFYVSTPISIKEYIRTSDGIKIPASEIEAGMRIKIESYLTDLVGESGAGLTFIIMDTNYNDTTETCQISTGVPDSLAIILSQLDLAFS